MKPNDQLLVEFVFELLRKHGDETLKAIQEEKETDFEKQVAKAEYEEER